MVLILKSLKKKIIKKELTITNELNISANQIVVAAVGRFDPQKDHLSLLKAINTLNIDKYQIVAIFIGKGLNNMNLNILNYIKDKKLLNKCFLLDSRDDISSILNDIDIFVLPSLYGEGFPNVLAEAMSSECFCITTDVGDSKLIIDNNDWVVEPGNYLSLANTIKKAILIKKTNHILWNDIKSKNRKIIIENYSLNKMIIEYNKLWKSI